MERRVLLAIFLAFLTLYAWQALFVKPQPKPDETKGPAPSAQTATTAATGTPAAPPAATAAAVPAVAPSTSEALVTEPAERDIRVETADVVAVFTNRGGRLKSWRLKHYLDRDKQPVELVVTDLPAGQPLPFTLRTDDAGTTSTLNAALYAVSGVPPSGPIASDATVVFEYKNADGLHAVKEFHVKPTSYTLGFRAQVSSGDRALSPGVEWGPGLGDSDATTGRYAVKPEGLFSSAGKVQRLAVAAVAKQPVYEDQFDHAGVDDHYFTSSALQPGRAKVTYQPVSIPSGTANVPARDLMAYTIDPAPRDQAVDFYIGPKDFDQLAAINRDLVRMINFGMWSWIIVPLLQFLKLINSYVGNYGWSIILLTIFINAMMFPLRHKSVVSMRKMQEIQPEAKLIQDRYAKIKASDPAKQKMNQELMALYKERGVNPASGCIPMLLTFPVLFAFYSLLSSAIELRGAPFIFWLHDLSLPDPYYVTPILMGGSQLWQQWIAPATGVDPAQRKMMMFMPLVFTFIFVAAPSGTVLYWLISNLWAIGQQYLTNYMIGPPNVRTLRPAAERRLKRVGASKTEAAAAED